MTSRTASTRAHARFTAARFIGAAVVAGALITGSLLASSTATAAPAPGVPAVTAGLDYVALGDSYSAGLGLTPLTGLPTPECGQSSVNFPHQIATAYGLNLTDVSCSGAETGDVTVNSQYGNIAPQIAALSADTDVVTLTIGGNDLGFTDIVQSCLAASADGPLLFENTLPNCATAYTAQGDLLAAKIAGPVSTSLAETYAAVAAAAPNAKVFVVGYPSIFPATVPAEGCFTAIGSAANTFPFTTIDAPYLHSVEVKLDAAIQNAAATAGFTYVPSFASSFGHNACVTDGSAYVNGVRLAGESLDPGTLHPNTLGATFLTDSVSAALDAAFPAVVAPTLPTPPVASGPTAVTPKPVLANTGLDGGLLAGGLALAVLLLSGGVLMAVARRKAA
ncbi:GDSL-like Lipase/Acylhydrolase family protein [Agreia bicolorata]|uniref:GDSL-like Lipase/Acylhydrolase family protein n=1 Tax=Agreia bicolorata TaxID=110935 RepID=A0A1T4WXQ5_9MICO|nr:SGNH/GDSL hydrolase family protein [Agreia bicolorata]SKA82084.1 GDSL-like Lipase/Acylhydrolase family protein [Agreia bicolorata]